MRSSIQRALLASILLLTACASRDQPGEPVTPPATSSAASSEQVRETRNVSYRGIVEELGSTIYMQGTHKLTLGDGRMLLLESLSLDLEAFVDREVEAFGSLRPTVEAGGIIMRVEHMTDLSASSAASQSALPSTSSVSPVSSIPPPPTVASSAAPAPIPERPASSEPAQELPADPSRAARIEVMAAEDMDERNWTQQYCTDHVGFCIPVHRNWWYRSFGNTTSTLWHVEINSESFESIGSGPLAVNLVGGDLSGSGDGSVVVAAGRATGYKRWTQGRHFEITADARLEAAVRYITGHLRATESP
jgi:hypothetical protein